MSPESYNTCLSVKCVSVSTIYFSNIQSLYLHVQRVAITHWLQGIHKTFIYNHVVIMQTLEDYNELQFSLTGVKRGQQGGRHSMYLRKVRKPSFVPTMLVHVVAPRTTH